MVERKAFLPNPKHQYRVSQKGEHDGSADNKKVEIIMGIQVCLISHMNFNYNKNGGRKSFCFANLKHQYCVSQCGEHGCSANNKKNGDYHKF